MKRSVHVLMFLPAALLFALPATTQATSHNDVIWDNGGIIFSPALTSDLDLPQHMADDFSFSSPYLVTDFHWSGWYSDGVNFLDPVSDDFTITIYGDDAGSPGDVVQNVVITSLGRAAQPDPPDQVFWYDYDAFVDPFKLAAGDYWFSVVNDTTAFPDLSWGWGDLCS